MKLIISNLSWSFTETKKVIKILKRNNINGIEISISKLFNNNFNINNLIKIKNFWKKIKLVFAQLSLFYLILKMHIYLVIKSSEKFFLMKLKKNLFM